MICKRRLLHTGLDPAIVEALLEPARPWIDHDCQATSAIETLHQLQTQPYDLLVTGREVHGLPVEQFLEEALRSRPALPVLMVAPAPDYSEAVRLARLGISEYIPWEPARPGSTADALHRLRRALEGADECQPDGTGRFRLRNFRIAKAKRIGPDPSGVEVRPQHA